MNSILRLFLIITCSINLVIKPINLETISQKISTFLNNNSSELKKYAYPVAATLTCGALIYKTWEWIENTAPERFDNQIVDAIVLMLTMNFTIDQLSPNEKEQKFRQKAKLINYRIRILKKIRDKIPLIRSDKHRKTLTEAIDYADKHLQRIDIGRKLPFFIQNPYESEYTNATHLDELIENQIVDSIIFGLKPEDECTKKELLKKTAMTLRQQKIISKLKGKIHHIWLNKLIKFFNFMSIQEA